MRMSTFWSSMMVTLRKLGEYHTTLLEGLKLIRENTRTTFMVDDWITHTPRDILAKNFGVDASVFDKVPEKFPYILNGTVSDEANNTPQGTLTGNSSYVYHTYKHPSEPVPGSGGTFRKIDSKNFPVSQTIAAALVELEPKGLRELHWHPNVSWSSFY